MRLYRGMKKRYDPSKVPASPFENGTDFTDCSATALRYAQGSRGVLMVLDVPEEGVKPGEGVTEEYWVGMGPKRFMVWGKFDDWLVATFPAKDLRAQLRERGLRNATDEYKSVVLVRIIDDELRRRELEERGLGRIPAG